MDVAGISVGVATPAETMKRPTAGAATVTSLNDSSSSIEPGDVSVRASMVVVIDSGRARCSAVCESPISMATLQVENGAVKGAAASSTSTHAHAFRTYSAHRDGAHLRVGR